MSVEKEFYEYYVSRFAKLYDLQLLELRPVVEETDIEEFFCKHYETLHSLGDKEMMESIYHRVGDKMHLLDLDLQWDKKYPKDYVMELTRNWMK